MRRINYPVHRKSPFKHHVRKHMRGHRPVTDYDRGKGKAPYMPPHVRTPKSLKPKQRGLGKGGSYAVIIDYTDHSSENLIVGAQNYPSALSKSLTERREIKAPHSILLSKRD